MTVARVASAILVSAVLVSATLAQVPGAAKAWPVGVTSTATVEPITNPVVALPGASSAMLLHYRSTSIAGTPVALTGSLLLPKTAVPHDGWPLAVWNHMTVGGADKCAPSRARRGMSAYADMTSGDLTVAALLRAGFAVVRPDYEGIGSAGPHPYLIGRSLATSVIDAATAARAIDPRIGQDVVVAGHSEGAVAALFAAAEPEKRWGDMQLRAVAAYTPPTRMADLVSVIGDVPVASRPVTGDLVALAALLVSGATQVDTDFARLIRNGGLSPRAQALMPQVETKCFRDLAETDSFGGLAPREVLGPKGDRAKARLATIVDANDVAHLNFPSHLPVRIDAGIIDAVIPLPFAVELADTYRRRGVPVTYAQHLAGHSTVPRAPATAGDVVGWLARRAGVGR